MRGVFLVFLGLLYHAHGTRPPNPRAGDDFGQFLELQHILYQSIQANFTDQEALLVAQQEQITALNHSNQILSEENQKLRKDLTELQIYAAETYVNLLNQIATVIGRLEAAESSIKQVDSKASDALEQAVNSVKDVRFGAKQTEWIYMGPGFIDTPGYLITGVQNDGNAEADLAHRRPIEVLRNGNWQGATWL